MRARSHSGPSRADAPNVAVAGSLQTSARDCIACGASVAGRMRARRLTAVDVFTSVPLQGHPGAAVLDADGLDDAAMQRIAAWTNLSETTFVLPPTAGGASYRLRIFTPRSELAFAGHPTIGSAHAVL